MSAGANAGGTAALGSPDRLILVGYRGAGKTAVGRLVARHIGWDLVDTDELIERAAGRSIAAIFETSGQAAFRELESRAIEQAVGGTRRVISVGGGAVVAESNRERLRAAGLCIWLTAPPEELYRRLQADPNSASQRPALTDTPGLAEVRRVLAFREPFYQAAAHRVVSTSGQLVEDVAQEVIVIVTDAWRSAGGA